MAIFIDQRNQHGAVVQSKDKFLRRFKSLISTEISRILKNTKIKDIFKKGNWLSIKKRWMNTPSFRYDYTEFKEGLLLLNNTKYEVGDIITIQIRMAQNGEEGSESDDDGESGSDESGLPGSDDYFHFYLTHEEFRNVIFDLLELPNLQERPGLCTKSVRTRAGYSKYGTPSKLDLKKTFALAIARRIASKPKEAAFLDDLDLRYKYYKQKPTPWTKAVVYMVMDVSGSMDADKRGLAKKFFALLSLFLDRKYETVDIVFIRHSDVAEICNEELFFSSAEGGYTRTSTAFEIIKSDIPEHYPPSEWNIYIAQVGDGGNDPDDNTICERILRDDLIKLCNYIMYLQVGTYEGGDYAAMFKELCNSNSKFVSGYADTPAHIFPAFYEFFKKG